MVRSLNFLENGPFKKYHDRADFICHILIPRSISTCSSIQVTLIHRYLVDLNDIIILDRSKHTVHAMLQMINDISCVPLLVISFNCGLWIANAIPS